MNRFLKSSIFTVILFFCSSYFAFAHININPPDHNFFSSGFFHPLAGADHILVMVVVGLWAAQLGGKAFWGMPMAFIIAMEIGFMLALSGVNLPFVEPIILASVVAIGLLTIMVFHIPMVITVAIITVFAVFHGHAHGSEFNGMGAVGYGFGFAVATALLHMVGIATGLVGGFLSRGMDSYRVTRIGGMLTALVGLYLAFSA
ncbi:MAG: urease accessory protein [Candidatus Tokpelaia sp. JSC189]|nr:MAG: urease accessory protein [Candidatus Tokpelaia sp. JSC189]